MSSVTAESTATFLPPGRSITRADRDALPDDGHRYELVDGVLVVSPSPSTKHQQTVTALIVALHAASPPSMSVLTAPFDVALSDDTVVQPDVLIAERRRLGPSELSGPPLLAIEVLSPSTRHLDLAFKRARYEAAGCPSYWVVDPDQPSILCWELTDGVYVEVARARGEDELTVSQPFPFRVRPVDLLD